MSAQMLASSVAAQAVAPRFGKKATGVSARKAISKAPIGGHRVQVRTDSLNKIGKQDRARGATGRGRRGRGVRDGPRMTGRRLRATRISREVARNLRRVFRRRDRGEPEILLRIPSKRRLFYPLPRRRHLLRQPRR